MENTRTGGQGFEPLEAGISIHDTITITKKCGEGSQYTWGGYTKIGVVTSVGFGKLTMREPDCTEYVYDNDEIRNSKSEIGHIYSVSRASEVQYIEACNKEVKAALAKLDDAHEKYEEVCEWQRTYVDSLSMLSRMARFIKSFK